LEEAWKWPAGRPTSSRTIYDEVQEMLFTEASIRPVAPEQRYAFACAHYAVYYVILFANGLEMGTAENPDDYLLPNDIVEYHDDSYEYAFNFAALSLGSDADVEHLVNKLTTRVLQGLHNPDPDTLGNPYSRQSFEG
jgi:hypothetical protein